MSDVRRDTALKVDGGSNELQPRGDPAVRTRIAPCSQTQIVLWRLEQWNETPEQRMQFLLEDIEFLLKELEDQWDERERYEILDQVEMRRVEVRIIAASLKRSANSSQAQRGHNVTDSASASRADASDAHETPRNYRNWLKFAKSKRKAIVPAPGRVHRVKTKTASPGRRRIFTSFGFQIKALFGLASFACNFIRRR